MIYTLEKGVQPTSVDRFYTGIKFATAGAMSGLVALFLGNLLYSHYYVSQPGYAGGTTQTVKAAPVAVNKSDQNDTGTTVNTTAMQSTMAGHAMQYGDSGMNTMPSIVATAAASDTGSSTDNQRPTDSQNTGTTPGGTNTGGSSDGTGMTGGTSGGTGGGDNPGDTSGGGVTVTIPGTGIGIDLGSGGANVDTPVLGASL